MILRMNRYWINQPSTSQPDHELHGTLVLANPDLESGPVCDVYHTKGDVISQRVFKLSLSEGWPSHLR